jgi:hypothetical protein
MNIHQAGRLHVEPTAGLLAADIAKAPLITASRPAVLGGDNPAAFTRQMPRYCRSVCAGEPGGLGFTVGTFIQLRCVRWSLPGQLGVQFLVAHRIT